MKPRLLIKWRVSKYIACSDCQHLDETGRTLDCHVADRFAIFYWDDFADRHVKIMDIKWADRVG